MAVSLVLVLVGVYLTGGSAAQVSCNGTRKMFCPDECENAQCFSYPKATCRMNDCYYCKTEFVDENNQVVDCDKDIASSCLGGPVNCSRDPCVEDCKDFVFSHCRRKRCSCEAEFFHYDKKINCTHPGPFDCPIGSPVVQCEMRMCERVKCVEHPNAQCRLTTCGECKTIFLDKQGNDLHCNATPGDLLTCPTKTVRNPNCRDHCKGAKCAAYPEAACSVNDCKNCKVEWKINGKEVDCAAAVPKASRVGNLKPKALKRAKLVCRVSGSPAPKVTWLKDGIVACSSDRRCKVGYRVFHKKKTSKLVIGKLTDEFKGIYTCQAVNKMGKATVDFNVLAETDQP